MTSGNNSNVECTKKCKYTSTYPETQATINSYIVSLLY